MSTWTPSSAHEVPKIWAAIVSVADSFPVERLSHSDLTVKLDMGYTERYVHMDSCSCS
jgi:hypothetical protein